MSLNLLYCIIFLFNCCDQMISQTTKMYNKNSEMELELILLNHMENTKYSSFIRPANQKNEDSIKDLKSLYLDNDNSIDEENHQKTIIQTTATINQIEALRETENDFILTLNLVHRWHDYRLALNESFEFLSLTYFKSKIWRPDVYIYNQKYVYTPRNSYTLIWLYQDGFVMSSEQIRLSAYCQINLWRFPLDTQNCDLVIGSRGYPREDLELQWRHPIGSTHQNMIINTRFNKEFKHPVVKLSMNRSYSTITGKFSVLIASMKFQRNYIYHLIYTFLPSSLIVFVSWMSFYIDHKAVPARVPFCLLTLLTIMTQWSNINRTLPRLSYLKAIDVWMFICLTFIILCLFEYAFVNNLAVRIEKARTQLPKEIQRVVKTELVNFARSVSSPDSQTTNPTSSRKQRSFSINRLPKFGAKKETRFDFDSNLLKEYERKQSRSENGTKEPKMPIFQPEDIDRISRYLFPFLFVVVNIIFWASLTFHD